MLKICSVGILVLALAGCGAPRPRQAAPPAADGSASNLGSSSIGKRYRVDENQSELRILVYRAGPLARLGHNHVVINRAIRGLVTLADAAGAPDVAGKSEFSLSVPVAGFVVDDAQARREEGADFAAEVPDDARTGTLHNMQSTAVLDADEFPVISISGVNIAARPGADSVTMTAAVAFSVAGHESKIDVPFALQIDSTHMVATGTVELRQTALGLTPYSLMLGALQVQDAIIIKFKILANL
ncbi:MAG: YceI family protein [Gammaproteobacteria bacterium]